MEDQRADDEEHHQQLQRLMSSNSSTDGSEYLDVPTTPVPENREQSEVDSYGWESDQEELSFLAGDSSHHSLTSAFVFGEDNHPTSVWPPRHPSETDYHYLESGDIPQDTVSTIEEVERRYLPASTTPLPLEEEHEVSITDVADEIENEREVTVTNMAPVDNLVSKFDRTARNWSQNYVRHKNKTSILPGDLEDMKAVRNKAESEADDIFDEVADENNHIFKNVLEKINKIRGEMSQLYKIDADAKKAAEAAAPAAPALAPAVQDPDLVIDNEVKKLLSVMEHYNNQLDKMVTEMDTLFAAEKTDKSIQSVKEALESSRELYKSSNDLYKKVIAEVSVYTTAGKKDDQIKKSDALVNKIKKMFDTLKDKGEKYIPAPVSTTKSSIPLQRLPVPTFSGKKFDYHRFKIDFKNHVKYDTEEENLLALKQKCLLNQRDKDRVANLRTLKDVWERLDDEYGNLETTICNIFKSWRNLKPPTNDQQFVEFMETIENGICCLESLDSKKELTSSAIINVEEKLDTRMKNEISRLITLKDNEATRQDVVLKYLKEEKKSAQLRVSNYGKKEKDDQINSNYTGSGRGRGGHGRGRGQGRGGNRGGKSSRGNINNSSNCLLCGENHSLSSCPKWFDEQTDKRLLLSFCMTNKICTSCLKIGHNWRNCRTKDEEKTLCPCGGTFNVRICCLTDDCIKRNNWEEIRNNNSNVSSNSIVVNGINLGTSILPIQHVNVPGPINSLMVMWDNCSQNTFIAQQAARKLKLSGVPISYILVCTDGSKKSLTGTLYDVEIVDISGNIHQIQAVGIDNLSSYYSGFKVTNIKQKVGKIAACRNLTDDKVNRDGGRVDLLVGSDLASLHPSKIASVGELVILRSKFGSGYTLMGHSKKHIKFNNNCSGVRANVSGVENVVKLPEVSCNAVSTKDVQFLECISTESVGVNVQLKCKSCKVVTDTCKECQVINKNTSYLEYLQDLQIDELIEKNPDGPGYIASYPYNNELNLLLSNEEISRKRAESVEQNLRKNPADMKQINDVFKEGFENGTFKWLMEDEIKSWKGQAHYIPMNVVYKDSESTPARIIFDSSQPDYNGRSLNSCMGKGSNPINHFGSVILQFRAAEQLACGDIRKMFNQIQVREKDMHLRRFFFRPDGFGGIQPFKIAVPTCVNFGETAAPAVATKVKNRTADDYEQISPKVANMIKNRCIMDDINIDAKYSENLDENVKKAEEILAHGKFTFKKWIKSGDKGEKQFGPDSVTKSLGLCWKTELDLLCYRPKLNFSKKKRNRYLSPDTTSETLEQDFPEVMTKRLGLKLNHSIFDPGHLTQPWLLQFRLAYRDILFYERENNYSDYDKPLPPKFREKWLELTKELFRIESLDFPRSFVPKGYNSDVKPILAIFSDGSDLGQCCVAYLIWTMLDGTKHVSLVTSRTKIASMTKITTPRSELVAAQMNARLGAWLKNELEIELSEIVHLVDASIILGMIRNVSLKFDSFTAPRVTEIQTSSDINSWYWIDTAENPSDIGTRGKCTIEDLKPGTMYREGPSWLKLPRDQWPLRSDFKKKQIPGLKKEFEILPSNIVNSSLSTTSVSVSSTPGPEIDVHSTTLPTSSSAGDGAVVECRYSLASTTPLPPEEGEARGRTDVPTKDITKIIDHSKFNSWSKLILVTAQFLKACYILMNSNEPQPDLVELIKEARMLWIQSMMPDTIEMMKKIKLSGFIVHEKDGIVYATTRNKQENLNPSDLIILSPSNPLTKKILFSIHNLTHRGVQHCVARSRIFYWIPQASKIMRGIIDKCFTCRKNNAEAMKQLMSPLPKFRLQSSPIWHFTMLDLFGPMEVINFVQQRTTRKTWAVIFTCLSSRACWVYLAESCSTDHLLTVIRKHESRNGSPAQYFADLGRNIIGANRVIAEAATNLDQEQVKNFAAARNVKFTFGSPQFPAGQGCVERLIQEVKKNLKVISKYTPLTFAELDCLLAESSYHVNSRPLQPNPRGGEDGFICPNDILMGRSDMEPPAIDVHDSSLTRRAAFKQRIIDDFWNKWSTSYFQTLVKYHKWVLRSRNATPEDVVMILDKDNGRGKFVIGVIDSVKVDPDGHVRRVIVRYKIKPNVFKYAERNVRGLALLVKSEERPELEDIDLDQIRFAANVPDEATETLDEESNDVDDTTPSHEAVEDNDNIEIVANDDLSSEGENEIDDQHEASNSNSDHYDDETKNSSSEDESMKARILAPSSSGRKRYLPKRLL